VEMVLCKWARNAMTATAMILTLARMIAKMLK
jgi:hypothetical protein